MEMEHDEPRRKRARKSRGRGLRTTTGCLTCRKRHKKCDETQPMCGPCKVSSRTCVFPHTPAPQDGPDPSNRAPSPDSQSVPGGHEPRGEDHQAPVAAAPTATATSEPHVAHSPGFAPPSATSLVQAPPSDVTTAPIQQHPPSQQQQQQQQQQGLPVAAPQQLSPGGLQLGCSPETVTSEKWTADFASTRWLDLLANDAAQADSGFSLTLAPAPPALPVARARLLRAASVHVHASPALLNGQARLPESLDPELERKAWQAEWDATLSDHEALLFRHFADRCARWLDLFDPQKHFSTYAIRLALRNTGLMKAILALAAKHRAASEGLDGPRAAAARDDGESDEWIRYYYETLHYIPEALAYPSYTHSEELLATAIVVSAYEMLDEADGSGNWQRHLKGVFWIQRSQDVDGGCGGLRQAVWWAWLRQDIWAAFREKRHCLSFWVASKELHELDQDGLADRAIYLLSQAVNYAADARRPEAASNLDPAVSAKRKTARDKLMTQMDGFRSYLGEEYRPLPAPKGPTDVFTPLWIHPPQFGVALQAFSFAQILITLHNPNLVGFNGYVKMQRILAEAVDTICGIALGLKDEGCQVMSAQCLYGAGLCVQDPAKRHKVMELMEACEARVGWAPMATWREDLRQDWAKADSEAEEAPR